MTRISVFAGVLACAGLGAAAQADVLVRGQVLDINGRPLAQAQVTLEQGIGATGASAVTVFTDPDGAFAFPDAFPDEAPVAHPLQVRALGFEQASASQRDAGRDTVEITIVMRETGEQADVAPSSAWLARIEDPDEKADMVMSCVECHQIPAPEMRDYAGAIAAVELGDPETVRAQSWAMIVQHMAYLGAEMFGAGNPDASLTPGEDFAYGVPDEAGALRLLRTYFDGPMDSLQGYDYGAPVIANERTVIREYEVAQPSAVREALLVDGALWVADVNSSNMIRVDTTTGAQRIVPVPSDLPVGPHSMHRGPDDTVWVTPLYNGQVSQLDPTTEEWRAWRLTYPDGRGIGMHDLSFGHEHELLTDAQGRIWFSDIGGTGVGYFDPATGESESFPVPDVAGRPRAGSQVYGFVMESDRKTVWYSQLRIGVLGSFNTETLQYEEMIVLPSIDAGPRRITIDDEDVVYAALYGMGQIYAYDTKTGLARTYDLPDRASAPYAVTWDDVRQVLWVATANADAIYRFDPATAEFGVLPLPRQRAFTRMLTVDAETGDLVSSYANIHERVRGPRMAFTIHVGDDYGGREMARAGE